MLQDETELDPGAAPPPGQETPSNISSRPLQHAYLLAFGLPHVPTQPWIWTANATSHDNTSSGVGLLPGVSLNQQIGGGPFQSDQSEGLANTSGGKKPYIPAERWLYLCSPPETEY